MAGNMSAQERRGLTVVCVVLAALVLLLTFSYYRSHAELLTADAADSIARPSTTTSRQYVYGNYAERKVESFPFDPNEADSTTLLRLGLPPFMVRSIYKYRAMGGRYSEVADFGRIPGMTHEIYDRLKPYVRIGDRYRRLTRAELAGEYEHSPLVDSVRIHRPHTPKLTSGQTIDLNTADTSALKLVPGIGSFYARKIVEYRDRLGGFASLSQLAEIDGVPEGAKEWMRLDAVNIRCIDINHATKRELLRHPYVGLYAAQAITNYIHNYGPIRSLEDLRRLPGFTDENIRRLAPYLKF